MIFCFIFTVMGVAAMICMSYIGSGTRFFSSAKRLGKVSSFMMILAFFLASILVIGVSMPVYADTDADAVPDDTEENLPIFTDFHLDAKSAVLMEASTGRILYEMNATESLPPASVTKIMTLLLVMEAIDNGSISLSDSVSVSAYAASMGGSQVFLEEGEEMLLEDLLKCTVIASANDAAVALAEYLMGSEEAFVNKMNERAAELGLKNCHFENVTGLDDDTVDHRMSAGDIAVISRELIAHEKILEYSSVWMDTIRDGAFTLTNTNRLIRYYDGATGLKTGSTDKAKFCITATAERGGMTLIAVIMGAPSRDLRNACAKTLFDWGFSNYTLYTDTCDDDISVPVMRGKTDVIGTVCDPFTTVIEKSKVTQIKRVVSMTEYVDAPVKEGDEVGTVSYLIGDTVIGCSSVKADSSVEKINYMDIISRMFKIFILS